jgi:hypothetical protein
MAQEFEARRSSAPVGVQQSNRSALPGLWPAAAMAIVSAIVCGIWIKSGVAVGTESRGNGGMSDAVGSGFLAASTAGIYALSVRLERPAGRAANCLARLAFGQHRIVSNLQIDIIKDMAKSFDASRFDLKPGLYPISWAFGCWHDQDVIGPGQLTLLVGHPGETSLLPARDGDIVRLERPKP